MLIEIDALEDRVVPLHEIQPIGELAPDQVILERVEINFEDVSPNIPSIPYRVDGPKLREWSGKLGFVAHNSTSQPALELSIVERNAFSIGLNTKSFASFLEDIRPAPHRGLDTETITLTVYWSYARGRRGRRTQPQRFVVDLHIYRLGRPDFVERDTDDQKLAWEQVKPILRYGDSIDQTAAAAPSLFHQRTTVPDDLSGPIEILTQDQLNVRHRIEVLAAFRWHPSQSLDLIDAVLKIKLDNPEIDSWPHLRRSIVVCEAHPVEAGDTHWVLRRLRPNEIESSLSDEFENHYCFISDNVYCICVDLMIYEYDTRRFISEGFSIEVFARDSSNLGARSLRAVLPKPRRLSPAAVLYADNSDCAIVLREGAHDAIQPLWLRMQAVDQTTEHTLRFRWEGEGVLPAITAGASLEHQKAVSGDGTVQINAHYKRVIVAGMNRPIDVPIHFSQYFSEVVLGIDIGTMAIAVAEAGADHQIDIRDIGKAFIEDIENNPPPDPIDLRQMREFGEDHLIGSSFGIELEGEPTGQRPVPARELANPSTVFDSRPGEGRKRQYAEKFGQRYILHTPLLARQYEINKGFHFGIATFRNSKNLVCSAETVGDADGRTISDPEVVDTKQSTKTMLSSVKTKDILSSVFDSILNVFLNFSDRTFFTKPNQHYVLVATYPSSIDADARRRYQSALSDSIDWLNHIYPKELVSNFAAYHYIIPESYAVLYYTLNNKYFQKYIEKSREKQHKIAVFDFGSGTIDISAIDFWPQNNMNEIHDLGSASDIIRPAQLRQVVSFSVPLGGNIMDHAIATDLSRRWGYVFAGTHGGPDVEDLSDWVEHAKRRRWWPDLSPTILLVDISGRFRTDPPRPGERIFGDNRVRAQLPAPSTGNLDEGPLGHWLAFDVNELAKDPSSHLHAYLQVVRAFVLEPTFRILNEEAGDRPPLVLPTGRASLFPPIADAVREAYETVFPEATPQMIPELVQGFSGHTAKHMVAEGAVAWALAEREMSLTHLPADEDGSLETRPWMVREFLTDRQSIAKCFALVRGLLDDDGNFLTVAKVAGLAEWSDPDLGGSSVDRDGMCLYLAMRPPTITEATWLQWLPSTYRGGHPGRHRRSSAAQSIGDTYQDLLHRCLRPIHCRGERIGNPVPYLAGNNANGPQGYSHFDGDIDALTLVRPEQRIDWLNVKFEGSQLVIQFEVDGVPQADIPLSSTFAV